MYKSVPRLPSYHERDASVPEADFKKQTVQLSWLLLSTNSKFRDSCQNARAALQFKQPAPKQSTSVASMHRKTPEDLVGERSAKELSQTTIEQCTRCYKEKERVHQHVANFFSTSVAYHLVLHTQGALRLWLSRSGNLDLVISLLGCHCLTRQGRRRHRDIGSKC